MAKKINIKRFRDYHFYTTQIEGVVKGRPDIITLFTLDSDNPLSEEELQAELARLKKEDTKQEFTVILKNAFCTRREQVIPITQRGEVKEGQRETQEEKE